MLDTILGYITNNMDDKQIGKQIKKARADIGMSQEELGEKLGVTWEMISRYENGRSSARKYLSELAEVLKKPISYFFGVEDDIIEYNVEKIASALKEQGIGYSSEGANKVLIIDDLSILGFEKSLKLTRQYYTAPEWIIEKYPDVFALRMSSLKSKGLEAGKGDIGYFTKSPAPSSDDIVLVQDGMHYNLEKLSSKNKSQVLAVLIAQEKRYK